MKRRKFTREYKREAVTLITERGVSIGQASCELGVHGSVLRRWVQEHAGRFRRSTQHHLEYSGVGG